MLKVNTLGEKIAGEWGLRKTMTRKLLFQFFDEAKRPLSIPELLILFEQEGRPLNKTTLYREVDRLVNLGALRSVQLTARKVSYEFANHAHHHHFVCTSCNYVTSVQFPEKIIHQTEKQLEEQGVKITHHSLEFFGLCIQCN